ncbi:MAG: hypothetical protein P8100_00725 [bacterium]|jgi:hypothetical protein
MERLKALLAVVIFIAMILFSHPGVTTGHMNINPRHDVLMNRSTNDTTVSSINNYLPESNPDTEKIN